MTERRSFPNDAGSVAAARRFAEDVLSTCPADLATSAVLMLSELATNAIRHADAGFSVAIDVDDEQVRVEVGDRGRGSPVLRSPGPADTSGRGLRIVELLSDDWGVDSKAAAAKHVWFALRCDPALSGRGSCRPEAKARR